MAEKKETGHCAIQSTLSEKTPGTTTSQTKEQTCNNLCTPTSIIIGGIMHVSAGKTNPATLPTISLLTVSEFPDFPCFRIFPKSGSTNRTEAVGCTLNPTDLVWLEDVAADLGVAGGRRTGRRGGAARTGGYWTTTRHHHKQVSNVGDVRDGSERMVHHYLLTNSQSNQSNGCLMSHSAE